MAHATVLADAPSVESRRLSFQRRAAASGDEAAAAAQARLASAKLEAAGIVERRRSGLLSSSESPSSSSASISPGPAPLPRSNSLGISFASEKSLDRGDSDQTAGGDDWIMSTQLEVPANGHSLEKARSTECGG